VKIPCSVSSQSFWRRSHICMLTDWLGR
jgi:hypothetical protein